MDTIQNTWKQAILRALIVSLSSIVLGFLLYGNAIFISTMVASQFVKSGITAGIAYAALKSQSPRSLWAILLVWYALLTGHEGLHNTWLFILFFAYITGITSAILAYINIVKRPFGNRVILRPVFAAAITSIANGLIIIGLGLISFVIFRVPFKMRLDVVNLNAQFGALVGIAVGIGIEIAEFVILKMNEYEEGMLTEETTDQKIT